MVRRWPPCAKLSVTNERDLFQVRNSGGAAGRAPDGVRRRLHAADPVGSMGTRRGFSQNWQLVVNTAATTIVTFLMVFLIQNTQNRDGMALQIKLDELIRAIDNARDDFIDLEELSEKQLDTLRELGHLGGMLALMAFRKSRMRRAMSRKRPASCTRPSGAPGRRCWGGDKGASRGN